MSIWDPGPDDNNGYGLWQMDPPNHYYNYGRWPFYPNNLGQVLKSYYSMTLRPYEKVNAMERKVKRLFRTQFHTEGDRWGEWKDEYEGHEYSSDLNYQFRTIYISNRGPGLYYNNMNSSGSAEVRYWNRDPGNNYAKVTP